MAYPAAAQNGGLGRKMGRDGGGGRRRWWAAGQNGPICFLDMGDTRDTLGKKGKCSGEKEEKRGKEKDGEGKWCRW